MEQIKNLLEARKQELIQLKEKKERALLSVPEGTLRICNHGNRTQYYQRKDPKDKNGTYIRDENIEIARALAQKDYDKKVLNSTEKELEAIIKFLSGCPEKRVEEIFGELHEERQKLIVPISETDAQFVHHWENVPYQGKIIYENVPAIYTAKGERVRSKSEVIIADALNREGIPYRYEYPLSLPNIGKVYPDFTVLNIRTRKEFLWEHLGMMDEPEYAEKAVQKIESYEQNDIYPGETLILTYETKRNPINQKLIHEIICKYLK